MTVVEYCLLVLLQNLLWDLLELHIHENLETISTLTSSETHT